MRTKRSEITVGNIKYIAASRVRQTVHKKSIEVIGIDTEAYIDGKCFLICTSLGDAFTPDMFPSCFFTRGYRGAKFICYNLKYEQGALLQHLPIEKLQELQKDDETTHNEYTYKVIANKMMSVRHGKNTFHIYDALSFYETSLQNASQSYLGESKIDIETKHFTPEYVHANWEKVVEYCIQDAVLAKRLMDAMILKFEAFGVYPQKLYSKAYISWQYFKNKCPYIHVKKYWYKIPELIEFAIRSYNGGKFEVTRKGPGTFYEYDIVSAYPYEISNLMDIRRGQVSRKTKYLDEATYGFLDCTMQIPYQTYSPIAMKRGQLNYYPVGTFRKIISKSEYEYLTKTGVNIDIHKAFWIIVEKELYPYRTAIHELMEFKNLYKRTKDKISYELVKKILNSFYGKFVQLIYKDGKYKAGSSWNPIYGTVITANTRIRVSELQQLYNTIVAVHTDSVISTKPLPILTGSELGQWEKSVEGAGIILGSGIYQIGTKSKLRGFDTQIPLLDIIPLRGKTINISKIRPHTWREISQRAWSPSLINRFEPDEKRLHINFDSKRIWIDDYNDYSEVRKRSVESMPWDMQLESMLR